MCPAVLAPGMIVYVHTGSHFTVHDPGNGSLPSSQGRDHHHHHYDSDYDEDDDDVVHDPGVAHSQGRPAPGPSSLPPPITKSGLSVIMMKMKMMMMITTMMIIDDHW